MDANSRDCFLQADRLSPVATISVTRSYRVIPFLVPMLQRGNPGFQASLISKSHTEIEN